MRWGKTPVVGQVRERIIFLWLPKRFYRRAASTFYEDNGESVKMWLEYVYIVERWSYSDRDSGIFGIPASNSDCHWKIEAWRVLK
jgi:hypothetical protein